MIHKEVEIGAVTLRVAKLEQMVAFYRNVIGLQVRDYSAEYAIVGTNNRSLINLQLLPNGRLVERATGLYHLALCVPTRQALADWFRHYVQAEAPHWQGASDHGVSEAIYLSDPEGNGIEIYRDRPSHQWERHKDGSYNIYTRRLDVQALLNEGNAVGAWQGISAETKMGHIHLKVSDLAVAKRFYVDLLGFGLKMELPDSALFVAAGEYHHHIGLNTWHSRSALNLPEDGYGLGRYEIHFPNEEARQTTLSQLKKAAYTFDTSKLTIHDPFNIKIELVCAVITE